MLREIDLNTSGSLSNWFQAFEDNPKDHQSNLLEHQIVERRERIRIRRRTSWTVSNMTVSRLKAIFWWLDFSSMIAGLCLKRISYFCYIQIFESIYY